MSSPSFATMMRPSRLFPHIGDWRIVELLSLAATVPAFYMALMSEHGVVVLVTYTTAALACMSVMLLESSTQERRALPLPKRFGPYLLSCLLIGALLLSAALPRGDAGDVLGVRLVTAFLVILRAGQSLLPQFWRGRMAHVLTLAVGIMGLCSLGFWWLEPQARSLGDAMWLAFTTTATVGYGDMVPSTPASKIFAIFVVLLGYGALSLVTAAIAAMWVQSDEQRLEEDILRDLHVQLAELRTEIAKLREVNTDRD